MLATGAIDWWAEIKSVIVPLTQLVIALGVGAFTVWFQLRQARTAERKLFADIHDKRYKALTAFTQNINALVLKVLYEDDGEPSGSETANMSPQERFRATHRQIEELGWLFGDDVMLEAARMQHHAECILDNALKIDHHLESSDDVRFVNNINEHNRLFMHSTGLLDQAARNYLYVGHIRLKAPHFTGFTTKQLNDVP